MVLLFYVIWSCYYAVLKASFTGEINSKRRENNVLTFAVNLRKITLGMLDFKTPNIKNPSSHISPIKYYNSYVHYRKKMLMFNTVAFQ